MQLFKASSAGFRANSLRVRVIKLIFITGDTHSDFYFRLGQKHFPAAPDDYLIICGDFGGVWYDSPDERQRLDWLSSRPFTTLFVSGNHENFDRLARLPVTEWNGGKVQYVREKIIHLMRGQVFNLEGHSFFTMGGASSHDIDDGILELDDPDFKRKVNQLNRRMALFRVNHLSWWKEELPCGEEYAEAEKNLDACGRKVDYIITHCAPTSLADVIGRGFYKADALTDFLETVYQTCTFEKWFFGHYHEDMVIGGKMVLLYGDILCYDTLTDAARYLRSG